MPVADYTDLSLAYDELRYRSPHHEFQEHLRTEVMLDLLQLERWMTVADIATGTGRGALLMAQRVASVVGIDATQAMLERARKKAETAGILNADFRIGDAFKLDLPADSFDRVTCLNFLHLFLPVERQAEVVSQMARVIRPGGKLLIEIDNGLHGGPLGLCRKYFGTDIGYNWPWHVHRLLGPSGLVLETVAGTNMPGLWRAWTLAPGLIRRVETLASRSPAKFLMGRLQILARKR